MFAETHFNYSHSGGSILFELNKKYCTVFCLSVKGKVNEAEWNIIFLVKSNNNIVLGLGIPHIF